LRFLFNWVLFSFFFFIGLNLVEFYLVLFCLVWFSSVWFGFVWYGLLWFSLFGSVYWLKKKIDSVLFVLVLCHLYLFWFFVSLWRGFSLWSPLFF
jgi:hypothetical protein